MDFKPPPKTDLHLRITMTAGLAGEAVVCNLIPSFHRQCSGDKLFVAK